MTTNKYQYLHPSNYEELAYKCYTVRAALKLTQKEFGQLLEIPQTTISLIEHDYIPNDNYVVIINKFYKKYAKKIKKASDLGLL